MTIFTLQNLFVVMALVVAVLVWLEHSWLQKNQGKLPQGGLFHGVSLITSVWTLACGLGLWLLDFEGVAMSVPVAYLVYCLASWLYGSRLINPDIFDDDPKTWVIPTPYLSFCKAFALVYGLLCVGILTHQLQIANYFL